MIEKLTLNSTYFDTLEEKFTDVFTKSKVKYDIENNIFTQYFTYKKDDEVVAFINYQIMYERAELIQISVLDNYQNQGIASALIEYMINDLKTNKVESVTLEVKIINFKAIHVYEKFGFKKVGIRKGYYQGIDGILMEKELI